MIKLNSRRNKIRIFIYYPKRRKNKKSAFFLNNFRKYKAFWKSAKAVTGKYVLRA